MKRSIVTAALVLVALAGTLMLSSVVTSFLPSAEAKPTFVCVEFKGKIIKVTEQALGAMFRDSEVPPTIVKCPE